MHRFFEELKDFTKKCDWVLLILCLITSGFGMVIIASATNAEKFGNNIRYIAFQLVAIGPWKVMKPQRCAKAICIAVMSLKPMKTFGFARIRS